MKNKEHFINLLLYIKDILIVTFPFLIYDFYLRYLANSLNHLKDLTYITPIIFSISYFTLFYIIFTLVNKKARKIIYNISFVISTLLFIAQSIHFKIFNRFFGLSDVLLAGEASDYLSYALKQINIFIILVIIISIILVIISNKKILNKDIKNISYKKIVILVIIFILIRIFAIASLGEKSIDQGYDAAYNPRDIYEDFNNQNKNMEIVGFYEQTTRSIYLYLKEYFNNNLEINEKIYENDVIIKHEPNNYTGLLEGKNVILILLESVDSWLVNEEIMPTLTKLKNEGLNFSNRFAPTFGGGATINSEFAANTGFYAINNGKPIYNYDKNYYPYSIANMLKTEGYTITSIHENQGKYYNRTEFHKALGYKHYSLKDLNYLNKNYNYEKDTSLIKNEEVKNLIIKSEPFFSFVITYSTHLPYDNTNPICNTNPYNLNVDNEALSCIRNLARETDEFLKLLIEELEKENILDNTALVLFADHYNYGYPDLDYVYDIKGVIDGNMASKVPFIIWSNDIKHEDIDILMDTKDITPTVLNLLNIDFDENNYIGSDVFSKNHDKFIYFNEETFYDGKLYYNDISQINKENKDYINETLKRIKEKINKNNKIIQSDYFKYREEKRTNN